MLQSTTVTAELLHGRTHELYIQNIHCTGRAATKEYCTEFVTTGRYGMSPRLAASRLEVVGNRAASCSLFLHCPCLALEEKMQEGFSHL